MGFLSKVGIAPKEIPLAPVRIGCFLGAGLFILLFAYALALEVQRRFDDEVMATIPGLKLREVKTREVGSSTPQRWMDDIGRRQAESQRIALQMSASPTPPAYRSPSPPQQQPGGPGGQPGRPPLPPDPRRYSPTPHEVLAKDPFSFLSSAFGFQAAELQSAVAKNDERFKEKRRDSPVYL